LLQYLLLVRPMGCTHRMQVLTEIDRARTMAEV
jgi:hypothetical protein